MEVAILGVALLFFLGHALRWLFQVTKVPDLLFLVLLGYVLGPVMGVLSPEDLGKLGPVLTTVALIVILYEGGLRLDARELLTSSFPAMAISLAGAAGVSLGAALLVVVLTKQDWNTGLLVGLGIISSSSAIVIPMVRHLSISDGAKTILSLESAFTDLLAIMLFLVVLDSSKGEFQTATLLSSLGPGAVMAILCGGLFGGVWATGRARIPSVARLTFAGEAWAMLCFGVASLLGLNGALAVLAQGFTLGNVRLMPGWARSVTEGGRIGEQELALLGELTFLLKTFFFLYLGLLVSFSNWRVTLLAATLCLAAYVYRWLMVRALFRPAFYSRLDAIAIAGIAPRGLACAVLAMLPLQRGLPSGAFVRDVVFAVVPFSILATTAFILLSERAAGRRLLGSLFASYAERPGTKDSSPSPSPATPPPVA